MRSSLRRLQIVALVSFFPLAIMGMIRQKDSLRAALRLYYTAILIFTVFLMLLAVYTYTRGGNFIPPIGTFY
jgi:hypothetical protein